MSANIFIENLNYSNVIGRYPVLQSCAKEIVSATNLMIYSIQNSGKILALGNGGSSADAEHFCGELVKSFVKKRLLSQAEKNLFKDIDPELPTRIQGSLPAISLGVAHSYISAFGNDMNFEYAFAQQIWGMAAPQDIVFAISTSGNSKNVVHALKVAKAKKVVSVALTGEKDSICSSLADLTIRAPARLTHEIQELHLPIYHAICLELENYFWKE